MPYPRRFVVKDVASIYPHGQEPAALVCSSVANLLEAAMVHLLCQKQSLDLHTVVAISLAPLLLSA